MSPSQRLRLIDIKHLGICFIILAVFWFLICYAILLIPLSLSSVLDPSKAVNVRHLAYFLSVAGFFLVGFTILNKAILNSYLVHRDMGYSVVAFDKKEVGRTINFIRYQHGLAQISQQKQGIKILVKNGSSLLKKPTPAKIIFENHLDDIHFLTPLQSTLLTLALFPKSGSGAMIEKDYLSFSISMTSLSGHEIMTLSKQFQTS